MRFLICLGLSLVLVLSLISVGSAQSGRSRTPGSQEKHNPAPTTTPAPEPTSVPTPTVDETPLGDVSDGDAIKVDTSLVTVPIIASDRGNRYLTDLNQSEVQVFEDDQPQQIAFFASITAPFNVILMLDTSASTDYKLGQIQSAAISFVEQLQPADRIKVMSFDDKIRTLAEFTNLRATLRQAIYSARPGKGTKLYDAMEIAIESFRKIQGRKAIVIFTDGVDSYSDRSSYDRNRKALEESGIIVYPIRYDTRADLEAMIRQQQQGGGTIDLGSILGGGGQDTSTTPSTFPGGTVPTLPTGQGGGTIGGVQLPQIGIPTGTIRVDPNDPTNPTRFPPNGRNDPAGGTAQGGTSSTNPISAELDLMFATADKYLMELARTTGGELNRADTLGSLPAAFARIAAELRTQYSLGYYPTNVKRDGKFRKLKVRSTRSGAVIRARPGYRAAVQ
ncbi:MAG: VWA domain-containing protein [Pyrinomonadaceae bacterium]